jgi:GT2 family glycosyltransferase
VTLSREPVDVSAVIINFNGGRKLLSCVDALIGQTVALCEIVIVDNGSTDDSLSAVAHGHPDVRLLRLGENRGLPAARNAGLAATRSRYVLLIDNDIYLRPDCTESLLQAQEAEQATVICPRIILLPEGNLVQTDGAENHFLGVMSLRHAATPVDSACEERVEVNSAIGACYLLDRQVVLDAGGFDALYFFYLEDLEFSLRLRGLGHRFVFESRAVVLHDRGEGTSGLSFRGTGNYPLRRAYLIMRNRLMTMFIHYRWRTLIVLGPALLLYELAVIAYCLRRGWPAEWARAWRWLWCHRGAIAERRRRMRQLRKVADTDILSGGCIPFSEGLLQSRWQRALAGNLSTLLNGYWRLVSGLLR